VIWALATVATTRWFLLTLIQTGVQVVGEVPVLPSSPSLRLGSVDRCSGNSGCLPGFALERSLESTFCCCLLLLEMIRGIPDNWIQASSTLRNRHFWILIALSFVDVDWSPSINHQN